MTATTAHGITYPTGSDKIKELPDHLKQMADSIDTAITGQNTLVTNATTAANNATTAANNALPVVVATKTALIAANATAGRLGIVTNDTTPGDNGQYIGDGTTWRRNLSAGAWVSATNGDDFEVNLYGFAVSGTPFVSLSCTAKRTIDSANGKIAIAVASVAYANFCSYIHVLLPAVCGAMGKQNDFCFHVYPDGEIKVESNMPNSNLTKGQQLFATLTWPCREASVTHSANY